MGPADPDAIPAGARMFSGALGKSSRRQEVLRGVRIFSVAPRCFRWRQAARCGVRHFSVASGFSSSRQKLPRSTRKVFVAPGSFPWRQYFSGATEIHHFVDWERPRACTCSGGTVDASRRRLLATAESASVRSALRDVEWWSGVSKLSRSAFEVP